MSKAAYKVSVDLSSLLSAHAALAQQIFPLVSQAVEATAAIGKAQWQEAIHKAPLWSAEKIGYLESIEYQMINPFSAEIRSDFEKADEIERGRPARDLKRMLQTSKKTRISQKGYKYLIIPFRHNTPTASGEGAHAAQMPPSIYAMAKPMQQSFMLPPGTNKPATRLSASGHVVAQHSYSWGGRLPAGLAPKKADHHKTDIYAGMVRMNTKPAGSKQGKSAYLTFRVMSEKSSGWIVPAKPGLSLARKVSDGLQPELNENVGKAISLAMLRR